MDTPAESAPERPLFVFLAGLQAGMLGGLAMLAWLGLSAVWGRRTFWTSANLAASVFYGPSAIGARFGRVTFPGLALWLLLYSLLGAVFALAVQTRLPRFRLTLVSVLFSVCWYYLSFHVLWPSALPLIARLHVETPTVWGHVLYGVVMGRFPAYLGRTPKQPGETPPNGALPAAREPYSPES